MPTEHIKLQLNTKQNFQLIIKVLNDPVLMSGAQWNKEVLENLLKEYTGGNKTYFQVNWKNARSYVRFPASFYYCDPWRFISCLGFTEVSLGHKLKIKRQK